jgi:hypothetical protein
MLGFLCFGAALIQFGPTGDGWTYMGESGSLRLRAKTTVFGALGNGIVGVVYNVAIPYMLTGSAFGVKGSCFWSVRMRNPSSLANFCPSGLPAGRSSASSSPSSSFQTTSTSCSSETFLRESSGPPSARVTMVVTSFTNTKKSSRRRSEGESWHETFGEDRMLVGLCCDIHLRTFGAVAVH